MKKILLSVVVLNCSLTSCLFAQYGGVVVQPIVGMNTSVGFATQATNLVNGLGTNLTRLSMLSQFKDTNYVGRVLSSQIDIPYGSQINFEAGQIITPYREFGTNNYYVSGCTNSNYNGRYKIYYYTNDVNVGSFTIYTNLNGLTEMWTSIQGEAGTTFLCEDTVLTTNNAPIPNGTSPTTIPCVFDGHNSQIGPGYGSTYWYTDVGGAPTGGLQPLMVGSFETNFTAVAIGNLVFGSAGNIIGSETVGNNFGLTLANGATVFSNSIVVFGSITGNGSSITNATVSYLTNIINGVTNRNTLTRTIQWTIPVAVSAPAGTLGSAEIDAQLQRADGVWATVADCDIAGGATSILATNKEILVVTVPSNVAFRLTNSTSGTGYVAGLDVSKTNTFTVFP